MMKFINKIKIYNNKKMRRKNVYSKNGGLAALLTIVIVSVASLIMALNSSFLGLGELELGFMSSRGSSTFYVADGCMEETLGRIRKNNNYGIGSGTINLTVENGSCTIDVLNSGNDRTITVSGSSSDFNKKLEVNLTILNKQLIINSWLEKEN